MFERDDRDDWNHVERSEDRASSASCYMDWSSISSQIRWAKRESQRNKKWMVAGHQITVNGNVHYDTQAPGLYVNLPAARHSIVSFQADREGSSDANTCPPPTPDDCFFFDGDTCKQYKPSFVRKDRICKERLDVLSKAGLLCSYDSTVTIFPVSETSGNEVTELVREESDRQSDVCACDKFVRCLVGGTGSMECGWKGFLNVFAGEPRNQEFCMHRQCSFVVNGAGELETSIDLNTFGDSDQLNHRDCYAIWETGNSKKDWFFTLESVAVGPEVLHENPPTVRLPKKTSPSRAPPPTQFSCAYTKVTFWAFAREKWGSPCRECCPEGNIFAPPSHGKILGRSERTGLSESVPAWIRRERNEGARRLRFEAERKIRRDSSSQKIILNSK